MRTRVRRKWPHRLAFNLVFFVALTSLWPDVAESLRLTSQHQWGTEGSLQRAQDAPPKSQLSPDAGLLNKNPRHATAEANEEQTNAEGISSSAQNHPLQGPQALNALTLNPQDPHASADTRNVLALASALSSHHHSRSMQVCNSPESEAEPSELTELMTAGRQCRNSRNPVLVIDGGSTGTRGTLVRVEAESCPRLGRKVLPDSITFLEEGTKFIGLRQLMEKWLDENAGPDWASKPYDAKALLSKYPSMLEAGKTLVHQILNNAVDLIHKHLTPYEQEEAKTVGVPVLFFSTAGVRDTHDWYRRGLFAAFMEAINSFSGEHEIVFFTNEDWTRPIPGLEEGMLAFIATNQLLGNFSIAKDLKQAMEKAKTVDERKVLERDMRQSLTSIIEVGGASAQVVFPVYAVGSSPSFVNTTNLTGAGYLSDDYPSLDIMSTSYMQLGATSATGVFYKSFCSNPANLNENVCLNPCLPKGYIQDCSTGDVTISSTGEVSVAKGVQNQRVKPAAYYCTSSNDEIAKKALNRLSCLAAGIDPEQPLEERLSIQNCMRMEGTGDFEACAAAVNSILLDPPLPLPANQEASYTGFDTLAQIFDFMSTESPVVVTGRALVFPVRDLQAVGLLGKNFKGNPCELSKAAVQYCAAPVVKASSGSLVRQVTVGDSIQEVDVTSLNVENCFKLGLSHGLLTLLNKNKVHPSKITFALDIEDPKTGQKVGEYGWPPGAILREVLNVRTWATYAYELGKNHTVRDRWNALHANNDQATEPTKS
ncbi:putative nucleoside-triphosphatase [Cyclospora cayetanensis]|uniref:Nucleoside-triphosphatase n=1 Tax=Cyclospora cayetanensis TaxID=88456 RepID=A0A1D3CQU6_9EIME|nr:putative nucleoside-triphosphatase [Cyclospora cayetanensis]